MFDIFKDPKFRFDEKKHVYTYDGVEFISTTTFIKNFHKPFDALYWSKQKGYENGLPYEYYLQLWEEKSKRAQVLGTNVHKYIEDFFVLGVKNKFEEKEENAKIKVFDSFYENHLYKLNPIAFELRIFSKEWEIAGTIDSIFEFNSKYYILDWKTNEEFKIKTYKKLFRPFQHFYENDLTKYSIQMNIYMAIIEQMTGLKIENSYLAHIGKEEICLYEALNLKEQVIKALNERK